MASRAPGQQPEPGDADAGADLDDVLDAAVAATTTAACAPTLGAIGSMPELERLLTRPRDDLALDDDLVGELPVRFFV